MELQFPFYPLMLPFLLFLFMVILKKRKRSKTKNPNSKLPPGPKKLPLIGNLHNLLGLPHHSLRDLAMKHGPLMHLQLGEVSAIVVSSPKVAKQIMKTHDLNFADRPEILAAKILGYNCTDIVFARYGDYWRQLRKIAVMDLLSAKQVKSFRSLREEEVSNLIQRISLKAGLPINLSETISSLTNDITSRAAFGKRCKDKEVFISLMKEISKLERIHKKVDRILDEIIEEHTRNGTSTINTNSGYFEEDLADVLLRLQESGGLEFPLTTENIKAVLFDMFAAGTDTASTTIEWAMSEILKNPRVMVKVQNEVRRVFDGTRRVEEMEIHKLDYLKLVIKETLRLHPAAPLLLPRECRERCEIDGYEIPTKTKVMVNAWAIGRDPEHWSNAENFEPERFNGISIDYKGTNFEYIPFGAGRRMCPGMSFGIANVELALAQFLYHFDWKFPKVGKPEDLDMTECFGATVRRKNDLYLIPIPYVPS
ncbi:Cytochrome P450 [Macleaya cordata]|uniref:Cytochrome P450 n=1 Tax=Macleaya cordata TaxID=56857 RepID=A0A200RBR4_MACCD|nr:Cytochrome P450 [Macleaya cordata]